MARIVKLRCGDAPGGQHGIGCIAPVRHAVERTRPFFRTLFSAKGVSNRACANVARSNIH
jgi:hypothetical protein